MLSEKQPAEELDENNQKGLNKIVGKFLYYARTIDPTMLMVMNSLVVVQKKPTTETSKQTTQFLSYSATHLDAVIEYRKKMILHIYLDASYISEPEAQNRAGGYFFLAPKFNTPIQLMPQENRLVHVECIIMRNFME